MSISHSQSGLAFETEEFLDIRHFGGLVDLMWYVDDDGGWVDVEARLCSFSSSNCSRGGIGLSYRDIGKPVRCSGASRDNIHSRVRALQDATVRRLPRRDCTRCMDLRPKHALVYMTKCYCTVLYQDICV
jgi:hypothetical protein